jgi:hypothetical protein
MKNITGYENQYQIDEFGNVYSVRRKIIMSPSITMRGYYHVTLSINNKRKNFSVHRLVAEAFIPNPIN